MNALNCFLVEADNKDWTHWVQTQPSANIFHHTAWSKLLSNCYGYKPKALIVRGTSGQINAGIPLMEVKGFSNARRWVALPFTDHCVPLFTTASSHDELLLGLSTQFEQDHWTRLEVRWDLPSLALAKTSSHHVLHQLELEDNPDRVRSRFHSNHRRNLKTAEKSGLRLELGCSEQHLREFFRLHLITRRRQGMPTQPRRFFQMLRELLLEQDLGFIILAYHGEACIAASVYLKWQKTLMYKYGASTTESLQYRPNNLVMWTAIRWACENGFTMFDFGRTDNENAGLRQFKSGWGAQEVPLVYTVLSQSPEEEQGSGHLKQLMQKVIRISPTWVSQITGQLLYRYFG